MRNIGLCVVMVSKCPSEVGLLLNVLVLIGLIVLLPVQTSEWLVVVTAKLQVDSKFKSYSII